MTKRNDDYEWLADEDLLTEALLRLPVKNLLQCKAVSKNWYSLISSPNFIKSHYQRSITINNNDDATAALIVRRYKNEDLDTNPLEDGSYSLFQLGGSDDYLAHFKFPFSRDDYPFLPTSGLVGCVCGLICVSVDPTAHIDANYFIAASDKPVDIYIWNPATRQSKLIPQPTLYDCDDTSDVALGFGFDPIDFDFKVVRVVSRDIFPQVYSANREAWRDIEAKLTDVPCGNQFHICLHGFLFAVGHNCMVAYDLNKDVFICDVKFPVSPHKSYYSRIVDFKDSIAVINFKEQSQNIKLWRLDDEACLRGGRVEASWTLMLSIDIGVQPDYVQGLFNSVEFLLIAKVWFCYNSDKKVGRYIDTYPFFDFDEVCKYSESLLSVAGSKPVNWSDD